MGTQNWVPPHLRKTDSGLSKEQRSAKDTELVISQEFPETRQFSRHKDETNTDS